MQPICTPPTNPVGGCTACCFSLYVHTLIHLCTHAHAYTHIRAHTHTVSLLNAGLVEGMDMKWQHQLHLLRVGAGVCCEPMSTQKSIYCRPCGGHGHWARHQPHLLPVTSKRLLNAKHTKSLHCRPCGGHGHRMWHQPHLLPVTSKTLLNAKHTKITSLQALWRAWTSDVAPTSSTAC